MTDKGPSGVRGLLAKFENNNVSNTATSPPSRGRSPVGSDPSGSVRPLSKVRASFVAVERNTQPRSGSPLLGLRKTNGLESPIKSTVTSPIDGPGSPIERSFSRSSTDSMEKGFPGKRVGTSPQSQTSLNEVVTAGGVSSDASIFETPSGKQRKSIGFNSGSGEGLGNILKGSPFQDSKPINIEKEVPTQPELGANTPSPKSEDVSPQTKVNGNPTEETAKHSTKPTPKTNASRPADLVLKKDSNSLSPNLVDTKSPPAPRTPRTPVTPGPPLAASKVAPSTSPSPAKETRQARTRVATKNPSRPSLKPANKAPTTTKSQPTASRGESRTRKASSNLSSDHNKNGPKSPTRPVRLPNSMTAPTAASVAKLGKTPAVRPSSQNTVNTTKLNRKPSSLRSDRTTVAAKSSTSTTTTVRKQSSRAHLQPAAALERPKSRISNTGSRAPDESFLARMMRPTASSASKVHDKADAKSPPRTSKTTSRPPTRQKNGSKSPPRQKLVRSPQRSNGDAHSEPQESVTSETAPQPDDVSLPEQKNEPIPEELPEELPTETSSQPIAEES